MGLKDILVITTSSKDEAAVAAAAALGEKHGAHVRALFMTVIPEMVFNDAGMSARFTAEVFNDARATAAKERERLGRKVGRLKTPVTLDPIEALSGLAGDTAARAARHADLTILPRPAEEGGFRRTLFEQVLFGSGRPVLLVPDDWNSETPIGRNVLVAWNASKESARAVNDARPLMAGAEAVTIATVDAQPSMFGHGDVPGADIAAHLSRHGLRVDVKNLDGMGRGVGGALADEAGDRGADLIVMGGYGHSRLQQIVFGGATRDLASSSKIPLLLSH